jgi:hypothetical protein
MTTKTLQALVATAMTIVCVGIAGTTIATFNSQPTHDTGIVQITDVAGGQNTAVVTKVNSRQVKIAYKGLNRTYTKTDENRTSYMLVADDDMGQAFFVNWKAGIVVEVRGFVHAVAQR